MRKKTDNSIIRSSRLSLKFANHHRQEQLRLFLDEYLRIVRFFVDELWQMEVVKPLLDKDITSRCTTWLSARMVQCAGKQASGIVRGTRTKQERRLHMIDKLESEGQFRKARKLRKIYDENSISKPEIERLEAQLDSRFVQVDWESETSFDGWVTISSIGEKMKIVLPIRKTKHFNDLASKGKLKEGLRISRSRISLSFEIKVEKRTEGSVLGIDVGMNDTIACSSGQAISEDPHGNTYRSICDKLAMKKKGGNGFRRAVAHRTNYINWVVNQLDLDGVAVVNRENIRHLRKFQRNSRRMQAWNYAELFKVLDGELEGLGVQVRKLNPTYTSQRCSVCGWTRKGNRSGKSFKCGACGHTQDADLNASMNLSFGLPGISGKTRLKGINRKGFYWLPEWQEPIVPAVREAV
jgi:transposase